MSEKLSPARELQIHLDFLEIDSVVTTSGEHLTIINPAKMLAYLTDEGWIARSTASNIVGALRLPVPTHRTDNPIGALLEWATKRKVVGAFVQSENVGSVQAPRFSCEVACDGEVVRSEASSKAAAKREAALALLEKLAIKHGKERP